MNLPNFRRRLLKQRKFRQLLISLFVLSMMLGFLIVPFEKDHGNIRTPEEGVWWAVTTITTIGYGDYVPVTGQGRMIGVVLQISGAVMFGLLIAMIGSSMNRNQEEFYWHRLFERFTKLEQEFESLKKQTSYLVKDRDREKE